MSLRVLLSAYACEPNRGSEPGVGWNVAVELSKHHEVWVITLDDHRRQLIKNELEKNPAPRLHVVYYGLPRWAKWINQGGLPGRQLHYYVWQLGALFAGRQLDKTVGFDLVHHVTYVKYWSPSFLSLLPIPFLWGPVGGGESAPKSFYRDFGLRGMAYEVIRDLARWLGELDPFVRITAKRSAVAMATTAETATRIYRLSTFT
jgi:hypothetical protein